MGGGTRRPVFFGVDHGRYSRAERTRSDRQIAARNCRRTCAFRAIRHQRRGQLPRGAVTFGRALAAKLGVPLEIIPHQASGEIQSSADADRWDVAFLPVDEERKKFVAFGNAYHLLQSTFLVASGSKISSVKDADAKGTGIGGVANTATFRAAKRATSNATHIDFAGVDAAVAAMREGRIEAIALSRELLSGLVGKIAGSRILDDAFLNSSMAVCVPKGKPAALAYVSEFIEEAKASASYAKRLTKWGLNRRRSRRRE